MAKDIVTQLNDMQNELAELKKYKKSVQKYLQKSNDFLDEKGEKNEPISSDKNESDFVKKICEFYELESELDKARWIDIMCNDNSKKYWDSKRTPNEA